MGTAGLIVAVVAGVVGVLTFVGYFAGRFFKNSVSRQTNELLQESNEALRAEIVDTERRCEKRVADKDRRHAEEIADLREQLGVLRGQVASLTPEWANEVADLLRERGVRRA